jgi:pimeloyl-ACP methyl ester carboxylesterase
MKRLVVVVITVSLLVAGLLAGAPAQGATRAGSSPAAGIAWGSCSDPTLAEANAQCGFVEVPLDYRRPGGAKISLAVSRVRHTSPDADYQGVMLVNPGGPGGSGLVYSILGQFVPNGAGNTYDWIGFDPRGVGASRPSLSCIPDYFGYNRPYYIPVTRALERAWLARSKSYADACERNAAALLPHMKTTDSARDMESIRKALGARRINYYGFCYGTYLAQVYSTLFPSRVRRMVLDSNVDPRKVWYQANLDQDVAFDRVINIWFGWVARYDDVYHLGATRAAVRRLFYAERRHLRRHPAGGLIGGSEWTDAFVLAGYNQFYWPSLAEAFAAWVHNGEAQGLKDAYDAAVGPGDDNGYAVYLAVECTDARWPTNWNPWRRDNWRLHAKYPYLTWANAWFNAPCVYWHAPPGKPVRVDGRRVPGILLIDETLDAATPFEGSLEVRRRYPKSSLIAEPGGTSHANSLAGNACVDDQIAAFLADGTLPRRKPGDRPDAICAPLPQPVPNAEAASSTASANGGAKSRLRQQLASRSFR